MYRFLSKYWPFFTKFFFILDGHLFWKMTHVYIVYKIKQCLFCLNFAFWYLKKNRQLYICFNMHIKVSKSPRLKFTAHLIISSLVSIHLACKVIISVFHKICNENQFKINKKFCLELYFRTEGLFEKNDSNHAFFLEIHQCFKTFLSILFLLFCDVLKIIFPLYVTSRIHWQRFWFTFG